MTRPYRKKLVTVREAALIFEVKEITIREWCREGILEAIKPPGTKAWRIPRESIEKLAQKKYGA
jgi:excisionase family DNA binding protein